MLVTSRYQQTNAVLLDHPDGRVLVDSPYFPDELAALPEPDWLFATHSHFDHLLGRLAFPGKPLFAARGTVRQLECDPARPGRELAEEDAHVYVTRKRTLDVAGAKVLDVPAGDGHTGDGGILLHDGVLCCGDYLSDVELPLLAWAGSLHRYRATLDRLEDLLGEARTIVPGHGSTTDPAGARRRLREDRDYLDGGPIPPGRDTPRQREIDAANRVRHPIGST